MASGLQQLMAHACMHSSLSLLTLSLALSLSLSLSMSAAASGGLMDQSTHRGLWHEDEVRPVHVEVLVVVRQHRDGLQRLACCIRKWGGGGCGRFV